MRLSLLGFLEGLYIRFEEFFRVMDPKQWSIVIFSLLMAALVCFLYSFKKPLKDRKSFQKFLFYVSLLFLALALIATLIMQNVI